MPHTLKSNTHKSFETDITASTTQTQGNGSLTAGINVIQTVATAGDTITLPTAVEGLEVSIMNNGSNTVQIFPATSDDLGNGVDESTELETKESIEFLAATPPRWYLRAMKPPCRSR